MITICTCNSANRLSSCPMHGGFVGNKYIGSTYDQQDVSHIDIEKCALRQKILEQGLEITALSSEVGELKEANEALHILVGDQDKLCAIIKSLRTELSKVKELDRQHCNRLQDLSEELTDYKRRCQVWADQSIARDKYVHRIEKDLEEQARLNAERELELRAEVEAFRLQLAARSDRHRR